VKIELFGGLQVDCEPRVSSGRVPKSVWFIVALSLSPHFRATDAQLEPLLFGDESLSLYDTNARLRQLVKAARKLLGSQEAITRSLGAFVLDPSFVPIDFLEFEAAAAKALQSKDPNDLQEAADLYRADGNLLTGFRFPSGIEHPNLAETEAMLRETYQRVAESLDSNSVPENESPAEQKKWIRYLPQEWRQIAFALAVSLVLGLSVYALDPLALPQKEVNRLLAECHVRLLTLHSRLMAKLDAAKTNGNALTRKLPSVLAWKSSLSPYNTDCLASHATFAYNEALGGLSIEEIKFPEKTILFYEGRNNKVEFLHQGNVGELITLDGVVHVVNANSIRNYSWGELKSQKD
jgi:hypothetical protein